METIEIELIRIFVKVIQHGGFSKAAEKLNIRKSTVSKAIKKLEDMTETKLMIRSTRNHTLTFAGQRFYESCIEHIQALEEAQKSLLGTDSMTVGNVKLTAPEDIGSQLIAPVIGKLSTLYPKLKFNLQYTNQVIDLVKDGYDLAIRLGKLKESRLKAKNIGYLKLIIVAAPKYLKNSSSIKTPLDLSNHNILSISDNILSKSWTLTNGKQTKKISVSPIIESNQMSSLLEACICNAGLLLAPAFLCESAIQSGKVIRVLEKWYIPGPQVSIVSPISMNSTARLKIVSEALVKEIKNKL